MKKYIALVVLVLILDQWSKIYIKTNFMLGEEIRVFDWFRIHFIENNGAAWGAEIGGVGGKLALTIFRIFAVGGISYWLYKSYREGASQILLISVSFILAGAVGNIIDSVFYGLIFDDSVNHVATLFSENPYGKLFQGKVVDMLYFPMYSDYLPSWMPIVGGKYFTFFNAIFNLADAAISLGVILLVVFNKRVFPKKEA
ncbi:MAG: lipoprotein signal peptidase [Flavobacteriaceae bacterium]